MKQALEELLRRTGAAHGEYEATVLHGVYDDAWADWYAGWALANGLNDLLGVDFTAQQLSAILTELNEAHRQAGAHETWAGFTARRLIEHFRAED